MKYYLVGGAVRDEYLKVPCEDRDWVVVGSTPENMRSLGYKAVGKDFPVFLHPETKEEYALARTEKKTGHGYSGFSFNTSPNITLEDDLKRRDLTINAMAKAGDKLIDPHNGLTDLRNGLLRHVSDAFAEDPLRVLRVARFLARFHTPFCPKNFSIAAETLSLMQYISKQGELEYLSAERVWRECEKALLETSPSVFFKTLKQCHALHLVYDTKQETLETSLRALTLACELSDDVAVRYAAFLSPLGADIAHTVCTKLKVPRHVLDTVKLCCQNLAIYRDARTTPTPKQLAFLKKTDAFRKPERFLDLLKAMQASTQCTEQDSNFPHPQREYWIALYHAAQQIKVSDLTRVRVEGAEIARELDKHRCAAMAKIKRTYRWSYFNKQV